MRSLFFKVVKRPTDRQIQKHSFRPYVNADNWTALQKKNWLHHMTYSVGHMTRDDRFTVFITSRWEATKVQDHWRLTDPKTIVKFKVVWVCWQEWCDLSPSELLDNNYTAGIIVRKTNRNFSDTYFPGTTTKTTKWKNHLWPTYQILWRLIFLIEKLCWHGVHIDWFKWPDSSCTSLIIPVWEKSRNFEMLFMRRLWMNEVVH